MNAHPPFQPTIALIPAFKVDRYRSASLALATLILMIMLMAMPQTARSGARHIQDQGGSPYCLFAVNAYLVDGDMWRLSAEYYRRELPTFDGVIPYNNDAQALATEIYGGTIVSNAQWDTDIIRAMVKRGTPVAVSGSGHALVLISWDDSGLITYLDSLHSTARQQMQDEQFWKWWDGWGWWVR